MVNSRPWRDEDLLRRKYIGERMSMADVAEELGTGPNTIQRWLNKFGIPTRSVGEANAESEEYHKVRDESYMHRQYVDHQKSISEIASELGLGDTTVNTWLDKHGIEKRDSLREKSDGKDELIRDESYLRERYCEQEWTIYDIADECEYSVETVIHWMDKYGIDRRKSGTSGPEHHNWKDAPDSSTYYGVNWKSQRRKAIIRDRAECRRCGMDEREHFCKYGQSITVHHIKPKVEFVEEGELDYEAANKLSNLITVCRSCHQHIEGVPLDIRHINQ